MGNRLFHPKCSKCVCVNVYVCMLDGWVWVHVGGGGWAASLFWKAFPEQIVDTRPSLQFRIKQLVFFTNGLARQHRDSQATSQNTQALNDMCACLNVALSWEATTGSVKRQTLRGFRHARHPVGLEEDAYETDQETDSPL